MRDGGPGKPPAGKVRGQVAHAHFAQRFQLERLGLEAWQPSLRPAGDEHRDRQVAEPAGDERHRAQAEAVEPLEVVDEQQERLRAGSFSEECVRSRVDDQLLCRGTIGQSERCAER